MPYLYFTIPVLVTVIYIFVVRPKIKQYRAVSGRTAVWNARS